MANVFACDAPPAIAVAVRDTVSDAFLSDAVGLGADFIELRVDQFENKRADAVRAFAKRASVLPRIGTLRSKEEGGGWLASEGERLACYVAFLDVFEAVDIEICAREIRDDVIAAAHQGDRPVIASFHDFERTPPLSLLRERVAEAREAGADLVKVATYCGTPADVRTLAALLVEECDAGIIVLGMGPLATVTRLAFPAMGSRITYTSDGIALAPGQMDLPTTVRLMRELGVRP